MLFREGRHLVGNAFADHRGDACVADAEAEKIRAIAVFSTASRLVPVAMGAALEKELASMWGGLATPGISVPAIRLTPKAPMTESIAMTDAMRSGCFWA